MQNNGVLVGKITLSEYNTNLSFPGSEMASHQVLALLFKVRILTRDQFAPQFSACLLIV